MSEIIEILEEKFAEMDLFYAPIEDQILETLKRVGFGVINLIKNKETSVYVVKQLSWNMNEEQCLNSLVSVFKAFEFELDDEAHNFCKRTYCEKLSKDMFKITFTDKVLKYDRWDNNTIWSYDF